jgi:hypothetical protein
MIRRAVLAAAAAAAAIAAGALAAPAAYASTSASIYQPNCWGRTVKCLVAAPSLKYQVQPPPNLKYQAQAQPNNVWEDGG